MAQAVMIAVYAIVTCRVKVDDNAPNQNGATFLFSVVFFAQSLANSRSFVK